MKGLWMKKIICLLLAAALLAGCGNQDADGKPRQESGQEGLMQGEDGRSGESAMGRYGEEETDLTEELEIVSNLKRLPDGTLVISDRSCGLWESKDAGATWEKVKNEWLDQKMDEAYFLDIQTDAGGTLGVVYEGYADYVEDLEEEEVKQESTQEDTDQQESAAQEEAGKQEDIEQENPGQGEDSGQEADTEQEEMPETDDGFSPECALIKSDGTVVPVSISLTEDDMYPNNIWISEQGRMFVTTQGCNIYEVNGDGSSREFLTVDGRPRLIQFFGSLMLIDGYDFQAPLLYDMEKEEEVEDEVLADFVRENYGDRGFNGGSWYDLYMFPALDSGRSGSPASDAAGGNAVADGAQGDSPEAGRVIYLAGEKGLHRHVIGQDGVEQLIDGSLSRLGSPLFHIKAMIDLGEEEFLAVSSDGKLVRFTYDPDMPSMPGQKLKIYSLTESYSIRAGISLYQIQNPDVYVEYEIGMEEGGVLTREDALKKLNTRIMAGEGPDLLMLDGLPMDSYMEKGLLLELGDFMKECGGEETMYSNLYQALAKDGKIYGIPCEVSFPLMLGREKYVSGRKDLAALADGIEKIRDENPGKDILGICGEKAVMKVFAPISAFAWKKDNGEMNQDAIGEFLTQTKRIYDAQMDGLDEKSLERYEENSEYYTSEFGEDWMYDISFFGEEYLYYIGGYQQMSVGENNYPYGYYGLTSAAKAKGFEDTKLVWMENEGRKFFIPKTILGINAASSRTELAKDFLKAFLGRDIQYALGGYVINKEAFDQLFIPDEEYVGENGEYGSIGMSDGDGLVVYMDVYLPVEEELDTLKGWMGTADTPYIADIVLEKAVFEEGEKFIRGEQSLEEALGAIRQRIAIYMSE